MKKTISFIVGLLFVQSSFSQTVSEPEFINTYCILTSDSTADVLPKENGEIGEHVNKTRGLLNKISKVASVASAAGGLGAMIGANAGSVSGVMTGLKAMGTASSVGDVASSASALAGYAGMDVIFRGKSSSYVYASDGNDIRIIVKGEDNEVDPLGIYRIVRFHATKKERRIQWLEFEPAFLSSDKAKKGGYVNFTGHKYGEQSYLLTIPASEIKQGEYGIVYVSVATATVIPVATFSVK